MTDGTQPLDLEQHLAADPSSPLFARLAEALLRDGDIARAEWLCERGLEFHPGYSTGRLVHARCLAARGLYGKALDSLGEVAAGYPGNILLGELDDEWRAYIAEEPAATPENPPAPDDLPAKAPPTETAPASRELQLAAEERSMVDVTGIIEAGAVEQMPAAPGIHPEPEDVPSDEAPSDGARSDEAPPEEAHPDAVIPTAEIHPPVEAAGMPERAPVGFQKPGDEGGLPPMPVPSIHAAPVPLLQPVPAFRKRAGFIEEGRIVSRTLAEIYASQGAIGEAVETYRILLGRMPERSEELEPRLRQLEERLRTDHGPRPAPGNVKAPA